MRPFSDLAELLAPTLHDMGFEPVLVRMMGTTRRTLQVMAEPLDRSRTMTVDDCAAISRAVSAVLDEADPLEGAYTLEVTSPGLDRPLVKLADYARFAGETAKIETEAPVAGRRRFTGTLRGCEGEDVLVENGEETLRVPLASIRKARLVLTDALLKRQPGGRAETGL